MAASWPNEGLARVLDLSAEGQAVEILGRGRGTSFRPEGERLAIADALGLMVVDVHGGERVVGPVPGTEGAVDVEWSLDGRWLASASPSNSQAGPALILDAETGELLGASTRARPRRTTSIGAPAARVLQRGRSTGARGCSR